MLFDVLAERPPGIVAIAEAAVFLAPLEPLVAGMRLDQSQAVNQINCAIAAACKTPRKSESLFFLFESTRTRIFRNLSRHRLRATLWFEIRTPHASWTKTETVRKRRQLQLFLT